MSYRPYPNPARARRYLDRHRGERAPHQQPPRPEPTPAAAEWLAQFIDGMRSMNAAPPLRLLPGDGRARAGWADQYRPTRP